MKMKHLLIPISAILALSAAPVFGQIYDYTFTSPTPTNIDWNDIGWDATETTQTRDRFYVNASNAEAANIYVRNGATANLYDNACMYLQSYTRVIIGDTEGDKISTMHFIADGTKDTFFEITGRSSVLVNKNGVLTLDANRPIRWWAVSNTLPDDFESFVVDGGTVNGNFNIGANADNVGPVNVIFKNGATLNRNTEVNPLQMQRKSTLTFDNSTYNVWNEKSITYNAQEQITNYGWGNHSMNTGSDNQDYRQTVTLTNGTVWNGAGVVDVEKKEVAYFDFSGDITSTGMTGADLTLNLGRATSEESYFIFKLLNGSKISAKNVTLGSDGGTQGQQMMGSLTFEMQGSEGNISTIAAFGGTNMRLSRTSGSAWTNNFLMKGYAKYQTVGGFNIGYNEIAGGTVNFLLSGDNNIFQVGGNFNIIPGWNTANESSAVVNISIEDATNSTFSTNGFNVYSQGDSQVSVKLVGKTNTVSFTNSDFNMMSSKIDGSSSATVEIGVPEFIGTRNFRLKNYMQGDLRLIFSNGVVATLASANFDGSNYAGGTPTSYYVIKDGSSLTTNNDNGYSSPSGGIVSGEVGFLLEGDGSSFISKGQMNINPGNSGNTGGVTQSGSTAQTACLKPKRTCTFQAFSKAPRPCTSWKCLARVIPQT